MKSIATIVLCMLSVAVYAQDAFRYRLLSNWNDVSLPVLSNPEEQRWNELTGWVDTANNREYIIMGSIDSVYFFDVTNPTAIRKCDVRWGLNRVVNRDIEVFGHFAYCVSDNGPPGKMQIYDLQYLPDSVHLVFESDTFGHNVHSMFIDSASKRLYLCSVRRPFLNIAMMVLSIDTPQHPTILGLLNTSPSACERVHEVYVRNDTAFCSCEYKGLFVYDLRDMNNQVLLGAITPPYPYNGYNHTCWPDDALNHIAFTDELPQGQPLKVYRVRSLDDMTYLTHYNTHPGATPHNTFWIGNLLYVSWYQDGVYALDMSNPRTPRIHAFYDTYPQNNVGEYAGFKGCWGVFPFLPSGNIAASDMTNGLFMLQYDATVGTTEPDAHVQRMSAYPNPVQNNPLYVHAPFAEGMRYEITCTDMQGRIWYKKTGYWQADEKIDSIQNLLPGMYIIHLQTETGMMKSVKVVKQE